MEGEASVLYEQFVSEVDLVVAESAESRLVGAAEDHRLLSLAYIAHRLHLSLLSFSNSALGDESRTELRKKLRPQVGLEKNEEEAHVENNFI